MFFRSSAARQNRSELLVVVTPRLVDASATPPTLPTGEPNTWEWMGQLKNRPQ
jgi:Flp pilus assembly secretin CpaC